MSRFSLFLLAGLGFTALQATHAQAEEITNTAECEAAFGMSSKIDGVLTCTLPVMDIYVGEDSEGVATCAGELVSNATFCRVIIDDEYKNAEPDCAAVEAAKTASTEGYDAWLVAVYKPYTDAWKCDQPTN